MTTTAPPVAYRGSVKDVLGPVTALGGKGESVSATIFRYMDTFSVFDWGRMPDHLARKGSALAVLAADLFEKLESSTAWREFSKSPEAQGLRRGAGLLQAESDGLARVAQAASVSSAFNELGEKFQNTGLRTHYLGVFDGEDFPPGAIPAKQLSVAKGPLRYLVVRHVDVVRPHFKKVLGRMVPDYQAYREAKGPKLVPLEVVFRFGCPKGSSLLERAERDPSLIKSLALPKAAQEIGLQAGMQFEFPILELFTKLEPSDRPVSFSEALAISGLSAEQLQDLCLRTAWVAGFLRFLSRKAGLELADGKLEWGVTESGEMMLVDAIGPDELRLLVGGLEKGLQLSKEFLRQFYKPTAWYQAVQDGKQEAAVKGVSDWKRFVKEQPPGLPPSHKDLATQLYLVLTNSLTGKSWFPDAWSLERLLETMRVLESSTP